MSQEPEIEPGIAESEVLEPTIEVEKESPTPPLDEDQLLQATIAAPEIEQAIEVQEEPSIDVATPEVEEEVEVVQESQMRLESIEDIPLPSSASEKVFTPQLETAEVVKEHADEKSEPVIEEGSQADVEAKTIAETQFKHSAMQLTSEASVSSFKRTGLAIVSQEYQQ